MTLYELIQDLVFAFAFRTALLFRFQLFANLLLQFVKRSKFSHLLGKIVIVLRQVLLLDCLHIDGVGERLSSEPFIRKIFGIGDLERLALTRAGSLQILRELTYGVGAAD